MTRKILAKERWQALNIHTTIKGKRKSSFGMKRSEQLVDCFILALSKSAAHLLVTIIVLGKQKDLMWKTNLSTMKQGDYKCLSQTHILGICVLQAKWAHLLNWTCGNLCLSFQRWVSIDGASMWPAVLARSTPKPDFLGIAWAWIGLGTNIFSLYNPVDSPSLVWSLVCSLWTLVDKYNYLWGW